MSELINNREKRMELLKSLIQKMNDFNSLDTVREEIASLLKEVPYEDVVSVEQELFSQGMDKDRMLDLCDLHSRALNGLIKSPLKKQEAPSHPLSIFKKENQALRREISFAKKIFGEVQLLSDETNAGELFVKLHSFFNSLMDIEKHFSRKENLLFPFLEKYQITGPSTVMWGKDDQIRQMLKNALSVLSDSHSVTAGEGKAIIDLLLMPTVVAIEEMNIKEEQILFPMSSDTLSETDWYQIYKQSDEIGYCLIAPTEKWQPEGMTPMIPEDMKIDSAKVHLPTGTFSLNELSAMMNTMPFDFTFVDKDDFVRFFSNGTERIFQRNKAILGRKVQFCHPPSSVHTVEKILSDFKSGRQDKADFWINMKGKFIYISYYAVRDENKEYLGTLEVTQDLTPLRQLEGERRILSYE